jgi:hypothetical protein
MTRARGTTRTARRVGGSFPVDSSLRFGTGETAEATAYVAEKERFELAVPFCAFQATARLNGFGVAR